MSRTQRSEFQRIDLIRKILSRAAPRARAVDVGIGDDAAVLRVAGKLVWTVDTQVEKVHFHRRLLSWESVGYRSFQAAASDIAAMAARPLAALANLSLPRAFRDDQLAALVRGQAEAARACGCPLVGGNLAKASELSITTTVLGTASAPLRRSGARPGDELWLIGEVGMASLGFQALQTGRRSRRSAAVEACVDRWRNPRALISEGQKLARRARAALDVSDGLAGDAGHLAKASAVRLVICEASLREALSPELVEAGRRLEIDALACALYGGEDYALLATGPAAKRPRSAAVIGHVEKGRGVFLEHAPGSRKPVEQGFDHFARR